MARIADFPPNRKAASQADADFYNNHPEMTQDGKWIPIDPCNPKHVRYQIEWMDAYERHNGKTHRGQFTPVCDSPVRTCACNGSLRVTVRMEAPWILFRDIGYAGVRLSGATEASGETDSIGRLTLSGLEAGFHAVDVVAPDGAFAFETVQIECNKLTELVVWLKPAPERIETKIVAVQWVCNTSTSTVMRGSPGGRGVEPTQRSWTVSIIEKYAEVPKNHELVDSHSSLLHHKRGGMFTLDVKIERCNGTYGIKSAGTKALEIAVKVANEGGAADNLIESGFNVAYGAIKVGTSSSDEKYGLESSPTQKVYGSWEEAQQQMNATDFAEIQKYR